MLDIFQKCGEYLEPKIIKEAGLYSFFRPIDRSYGSTVYYNGRPVIMIGSNNYLGLTHDPRTKKRAQEAIDRFGTGCTGSRFLNGNTVLHDRLEEKLADLVGKESALVFTTGFLTNLGTIAALCGSQDTILSDSENHASIIEGCRLSKAEIVRYRHNQMDDLDEKLAPVSNTQGCLIVTDGVFSMTGDIVNLPELTTVKKKYPGVRLFLDDAHGLGVLGPGGAGTAAHFGLTEAVDLIMGTFSKSFASIGGFLAGPSDVIEYVKHKARSFIFSAAMPPASAATVLACLEILEKEPERIEKLHHNVRFMRDGFEKIGVATLPCQAPRLCGGREANPKDLRSPKSPIISVFIGEEGKALKLAVDLYEEGIFATPVVYPAVPYGQALIRTSYMATHTEAELSKVLDVFARLAPQYGILNSQVEVPKELTHACETYNFAALYGAS